MNSWVSFTFPLTFHKLYPIYLLVHSACHQVSNCHQPKWFSLSRNVQSYLWYHTQNVWHQEIFGIPIHLEKKENIHISLTAYRPLLISFWHTICSINCKCCCKNNLNWLQNFYANATVHLGLGTRRSLLFVLLWKCSSLLTGTTLGKLLLQWGQWLLPYHNIPKFQPSSQKDVKELLLWEPLTEHSCTTFLQTKISSHL